MKYCAPAPLCSETHTRVGEWTILCDCFARETTYADINRFNPELLKKTLLSLIFDISIVADGGVIRISKTERQYVFILKGRFI